MIINELFFSPTGSTLKVVRLVSAAFSGEGRDIDLSVHGADYSTYHFDKGELCVIGVPSYGGRVPALALEHLRKMSTSGADTVLVCCYGNRDYDDTLLEMYDELTQMGFHVIAAVAAVCEHSIMHQFAASRPNDDDARELRAFSQSIKDAMSQGILGTVQLKGKRPYKVYKGLPMHPSADKHCNKCAICARACPANAIMASAPDKTDERLCISCMRCVSVCPQHARKLNGMLLAAAGAAMKKQCEQRKENELFIGEHQ